MMISSEGAIATQRPPDKWRQFAFHLFGWSFSLILTLLLLEGALRVFGIQASALPYHNNIGDSVLGMAPERNMVWEADFPEYGGRLVMRTNNLGLYEDHDTAPLPRPGVSRMIVLGDSFTVGTCTPAENFPHQIQKRLNDAADAAKYEVLDAGVGRYSPYQYYVKAKVEAVPLKPQHLLVAFYAGNDFLDIIREDDRPYLKLGRDGRVEAHPPHFVVYRDPAEKPGILEKSRIYSVGRAAMGPTVLYQISRVKLLYMNLANARHGPVEIARYLKEVRDLDAISHGLMVQSLHQYLWFQRFPETLRESAIFTRYTLERLRELAREHGIRLTCTIIPSKPAVEPETLRAELAAVTRYNPTLTVERLAAFENSLIDQTLRMCRELDIEAIDLRPGIEAERRGRPLYYPRDMHLNVAGNAVVADAIVNAWNAGRSR
jgi:hypothetical protein